MSTSLATFLVIPTYRIAIEAFIDRDPSEDEAVRSYIGTLPASDPDDPVTAELERVLRAMNIAYDVASKEGLEPVMVDLQTAFPDLDVVNAERLRAVLTPSADVNERLLGARMRDGFLPLVTSSRVAVDLRVLDTEGDVRLLPLVTVRLTFDETVGGADGAVFQVPLATLKLLASELADAVEKVADLPQRLPGATIPAWSMDGLAG